MFSRKVSLLCDARFRFNLHAGLLEPFHELHVARLAEPIVNALRDLRPDIRRLLQILKRKLLKTFRISSIFIWKSCRCDSDPEPVDGEIQNTVRASMRSLRRHAKCRARKEIAQASLFSSPQPRVTIFSADLLAETLERRDIALLQA